jgi:SAM-dependent methyltransferase
MSRCLICGEQAVPFLKGLTDVVGRSGVSYSFLRCSACGSLSADPLPSAKEIASFYPEHYTFREEGVVQKLLWWGYPRWTYTHDVASVGRITRVRQGKLLDIGCGTGIHLRMFRSAGFEVEGVDISPDDCAYVTRTIGCPVYQGTLADAGIPPGRFDAVTMFNTLEHLPDPREQVRAVYSLLKPGGWFIAKLPVADGWQPALFGRWWRNIREVPRHLCIPSTRGLRRMLEEAGFTKIKTASASLMENACMVGTTIYPWAVPYRNETLKQPVVKLWNTLAGAMLTYLSLPEAAAEACAGRPSTAIVAARRPA